LENQLASSSKYATVEPVSITGMFGNDFIQMPAGSSNALQSIDWGTQVADTSIDVYFGVAGYQADGYTSEGFNAYEIGQFQAAFAMISSVTNVTFNNVGSAAAADFKLVLDTNEIGGFLGYFNPPGEPNEGVGVFNGAAWDYTPGGDLEEGGYGFVTIVHELLHGLGLAHPHDNGGTSPVMDGVTSSFGDTGTYGLNQGLYTTMTYNSGYEDGPVGTAGGWGSWGYEAGPMALDIAVLQDKYGVNTSYNNGNNTYTMPTANVTGTMWSAIWDTGGTDKIVYLGSDDANIDLRAATLLDQVGGGGWVSAAEGVAGGFTIANGVVIENAIGGSGADTITGNNVANDLKGKGGYDNISGGGGNDTLYGQGGKDWLYGDADHDTLYGGGGADRLFGGSGNDYLDGGEGNDNLFGQGGRDTLLGGAGRDKLFGGGGY